MTPETPTVKLHPALRLGTVTLKVSNLTRSIAFYTQIVGLHLHEQQDTTAVLGDGEQPVVVLHEIPNAIPQPQRSTGLYHAAILLPTRRALAQLVRYWAQIGMQFGYADHLVSEAFYISDLDGNGLELYRDRPREEWPRLNGEIQMDNAQIDFKSLFAEAGDEQWNGAPRGTTLGHMHLRIGDLERARQFYIETLGFELVTTYPGALFVSAGGYHHHLGLNIWQSHSAPPAPANAVGLEQFTILLPDATEIEAAAARLATATIAYTRDDDALIVNDPWQNTLRLEIA